MENKSWVKQQVGQVGSSDDTLYNGYTLKELKEMVTTYKDHYSLIHCASKIKMYYILY